MKWILTLTLLLIASFASPAVSQGGRTTGQSVPVFDGGLAPSGSGAGGDSVGSMPLRIHRYSAAQNRVYVYEFSPQGVSIGVQDPVVNLPDAEVSWYSGKKLQRFRWWYNTDETPAHFGKRVKDDIEIFEKLFPLDDPQPSGG